MKDHWDWRQTLSWKVGFRRAKSGRVHSCRGGLTSGFMGSLSCEARAWRSPRDPTLLNTIGTSETKERADTKRPLVGTGVVRSWRHPPSTHPRSLRPAVVEAVEHVREQWSLEVVEYDHGGNNDESNDNSW